MIVVNGWAFIPSMFTGIAWWRKYEEYTFFQDRRPHRIDGPHWVSKSYAENNINRFALNGIVVDQITFELHYMLVHRKEYVYNMANDFNRLEEMRHLVSQHT